MKKITSLFVMFALLYTQETFCMLALTRKTASRAIVNRVLPQCTFSSHSQLFNRESHLKDLKNLEDQRHTLEKDCFGHGGLVDLMGLEPDEGVQALYKAKRAKIEELKRMEEALRIKSKK